MASINRTVAFDRAVFRALYGTFGASVGELAEQVEASVDRTRAALKRLEAKGLANPQDVNDEAQGDRRSGAFKTLAWSTNPMHDTATAEDADEAFNVAYDVPTLADDEAADAPATKAARERRTNGSTEQPATPTGTPETEPKTEDLDLEVSILPETPEAYGDDRASFLRDHVKSLGRSKADRAAKAAARDELAKLEADAKPTRTKPSGDDGPSRSQARKCHCTGCGAILRMSPGAEAKAGGLPKCACSGQFVRSNVAEVA